MQLIGMLDSPYVRRVAVSMHLLGVPFEHRSISVFRHFDAFAAINPVVKAPSLVCDDGEVLMDSALILEHVQFLAPQRRLSPVGGTERQHDLRLQGLALAACEKTVQIVYERTLRPPEKRHEPWVARVHRQLAAACRLLDGELATTPLATSSESITQAGVTCAVAWQFVHSMVPEQIGVDAHPALAAHGAAAEQLAAFRAAPPV
ncbi:MAG: glutathione S-transferase [Caldimonas sp.]